MSEHAVGRDEIDQYTQAGYLDARQRSLALKLAGVEPDAARWHRFLDRLFLFFGVTLLVAAIGYFVAFNWEEMGRFTKFGLLELGVIGAAFAAARFAADSLPARAALLGAVLLTGPLLAFIGQTYQTGADSYELFRAWALLALPWTLVARWRLLWCFWLLIANVAGALYFAQAWRPFMGSVFDVTGAAAHLVGNMLFLITIEWAGRERLTGGGRSLERFALVLVIGAATFLYFHFVFENRESSVWQLLTSGVVLVALCWWYRWNQLDIVALVIWSFAGIAIVVGTLAKLLSLSRSDGFSFLLLGVTTIGLSALAAAWLRQLRRTPETI